MLFDYNKSGTISNQDIGSLIRSVGLKPSQSEVNQIISDAGGTGEINTAEFLLLPLLCSHGMCISGMSSMSSVLFVIG